MKIGTIGTGFIVDYFIRAVNETENVEVVACYSRNLEKAKKFASEHNIKKTYDNLDEMFKDDEIDTIYVASPNSLHAPQALKALQANKNVIDEKPMTSTMEEFEALEKEAKERNLFLWEAITSIYTPNLNIIKDHLKDCGNIKLVNLNYSQYSSRYQKYIDGEKPNVFNSAYSGGCLMDINIYNLHTAMYLFGIPNSYKYYANMGTLGVDTSGTLICTYDNFVAILTGAKDCEAECMYLIQGDKGTLSTEDCPGGYFVNAYFTPIKGEKQNIGIQQTWHMDYEVAAFEEMFENKDYKKCYETLEYSKQVMNVLHTARKEAGIVFDIEK